MKTDYHKPGYELIISIHLTWFKQLCQYICFLEIVNLFPIAVFLALRVRCMRSVTDEQKNEKIKINFEWLKRGGTQCCVPSFAPRPQIWPLKTTSKLTPKKREKIRPKKHPKYDPDLPPLFDFKLNRLFVVKIARFFRPNSSRKILGNSYYFWGAKKREKSVKN